MYLVFSVFCLSYASVITVNGQVQLVTADAVRALEGGDVGQCPSMEERERARNELH